MPRRDVAAFLFYGVRLLGTSGCECRGQVEPRVNGKDLLSFQTQAGDRGYKVSRFDRFSEM